MISKRGNILVVFLLIPFLIIWFGFIIPSWYNSVDTFYRPTEADIAQIRSEPDTMALANWKFEKIYKNVGSDEAYAKQGEQEKAEAWEDLKADPERWVAVRLSGCHDSVVAEYWIDEWSKRTPPITIGVDDVYQMRKDPAKWLKRYDHSFADRLAILLFFTVLPCFPLFGLGLTILVKLRS